MSLRVRLLLSYILVVVAFLLIVFAGAAFLLRDNPFQARLAYQGLAVEARFAARVIRSALATGSTLEQVARRMINASPGDTRLLFVDGASGSVLADTANALAGQNLFELSGEAPASFQLEGVFAAGGERWLYVAQPLNPGQRRGALVVAAAKPPSTPLIRDPVFLSLLRPLYIATVVALIIALIVSAIVARSIANPIQHVARAADAIAAGDLQHQAPIEGPSEVRELATNFNTMADRVRVSQQSQRDFLANVSHELKTPLTSIRGFAQAIADGAAGDPGSIRSSAAIIREESERMARMVSELLDLSRIETGQMAMQRLPVQIADVLRSCVEKQSLRAGNANVALALDIANDLPVIHGDGDRLAQVFGNLLDNALKHTPGGGKVSVSARAMAGSPVARKGKPWPDGLEVSVTDTGQGIRPEDLSRIFERFYQVDKSRARPASGGSLGLGLAIVKEIIAAHGGSIHAESVTGLGTKFVVRLPVERSERG